jgi:hypothetical protein
MLWASFAVSPGSWGKQGALAHGSMSATPRMVEASSLSIGVAPLSHFRKGYYAVIFGSPRYLTSGQQIGQFLVVSSCSLRCLAAQSKQNPWPQRNCRPYGCSFGEEMWPR